MQWHPKAEPDTFVHALAATRPPGRNEMLLAAREAGLRYVDPSHPGIRRIRRGRGFVYVDADGKRITNERTLSRIRAVVIPPAWTNVWISPAANGHIQAVGRDARGRLQYRYHPLWAQTRDATKYARTLAFARALPRLRRRVGRDLRRSGLPREKVVAAAILLLDQTLARVGNEAYARTNRSFGVTTLRDRHARVRGSELKLMYRGKGGRQYSVGVRDKRLARIVRACQELPGQRLFQYLDEDGNIQGIDSGDINVYLREVMGDDFSAKDFRTWAGTVLAAGALREVGPMRNVRAGLNSAVGEVARDLGNTATVCRNCYIHPRIIESYLDGSLARAAEQASTGNATAAVRGLHADEQMVLALLSRRASRGAPAQPSEVRDVQRRSP
jgi:DNA topoisomerase-1